MDHHGLKLEIYTARSHGGSGGATNTQALVFGGDPSTAKTEAWDGSSWTEVSDLSASVLENGGLGTYSSALSFGGNTGSVTGATEEWTAPSTFTKIQEGQLFFNSTTNAFKETILDVPSTTWASGGSLNTARRMFNNSGSSQDSILAICGYLSGSQSDAVESYDGSSWSEITELNTDRFDSGSSGPSNTDTLCFGGFSNP